MKSQFHLTISSRVTGMMIGDQGKYKNGVQKEAKVDVDVVPISPVVGSLWTIIGERENIRLALQYLHGIYTNTILKNGKSTNRSPFLQSLLELD